VGRLCRQRPITLQEGKGAFFGKGKGLSTKDVFIIILLIVSSAAIAVLIYVLFELRRSLRETNKFLQRTEEAVIPAIEELQATLKNVKEITDEINGMTRDVRQVTSAVGQIGDQVGELADIITDANVKIKANIGGFRAGIQTALGVLKDNLFKKGGSNED